MHANLRGCADFLPPALLQHLRACRLRVGALCVPQLRLQFCSIRWTLDPVLQQVVELRRKELLCSQNHSSAGQVSNHSGAKVYAHTCSVPSDVRQDGRSHFCAADFRLTSCSDDLHSTRSHAAETQLS